MSEKVCGHCKEFLLRTDFHKASREHDGLQQWCKKCRKAWKHDERKVYHRERYHNNKDGYNNSTYKRKYGITLETYNQLLENQKGVCAICYSTCKSGRRLAVDHNHTTKEVRSLLCASCNIALGLLKEDWNIVSSLLNYIERKNSENV